MNHADHVNLLSGGQPETHFSGVWADLGAGEGAFTLALADLLGDRGQIIAVDKDRRALAENARQLAMRFPNTPAEHRAADFSDPLDLPPLDGVVMANSLHFHKRKAPILDRVVGMLKPNGRLILVEYNVDSGNMWVPHPLSFETWRGLASAHGFEAARLLFVQPSRFLHEIYAAESVKLSSGA